MGVGLVVGVGLVGGGGRVCVIAATGVMCHLIDRDRPESYYTDI